MSTDEVIAAIRDTAPAVGIGDDGHCWHCMDSGNCPECHGTTGYPAASCRACSGTGHCPNCTDLSCEGRS